LTHEKSMGEQKPLLVPSPADSLGDFPFVTENV